jgi:hypothetical protein
MMAGAVALLLAVATPATAVELVTEAEAKLPTDEMPELKLRGSPTRRPNVVLVSPQIGAVRSPFHLKIRFQTFGGARIDVDRITLAYKKTPTVSLNQRLSRFIDPDGIDIVDAEAPPGLHKFRILLWDKDGRQGGADFSVQVIQ